MPAAVCSIYWSRGPYAVEACTVCRAKKSKCNGVKPVCGSCASSGRHSECSWGREASRKSRMEAELRKRLESLQAYVDLLEGMLKKCVCQDASAHLQFRPQSSGDVSGPDGGLTNSDSDYDTDAAPDSDEEITRDLTMPVQRLKLDDRSGNLLYQAVTAPTIITSSNKPPTEIPRSPPFDDPNATYVLQLDDVDPRETHPEIDWSRYLPSEVPLTRREHDKILDLSFRFFTAWTLRVVPPLFLRDMYRALSVPRSEKPPRTPHYSPMLHNAVLAISTIYSDDPHIRDPKTRQFFAKRAREYLVVEIKKPNISVVHAVGFIGTYLADIGEQLEAELFFGMSSRLTMSLGLALDSTRWVKAGTISNDEMKGRNWAYWTLFSLDVCWALYFGRENGGAPPQSTPMPFVDTEMDQLPWYWAPAKIPPQPNYLTLVFQKTTALLMIGRKITDVVNALHPTTKSEFLHVDEQVEQIHLELNDWMNQLPLPLKITASNRNESTPQRLLLHLAYWWCSITLHRPFFRRRVQDAEMDHANLSTRAAENILELVETWSSLYGLRLGSVIMLQVIFAAGTIFLLRALQATTGGYVDEEVVGTALLQAETCVCYLHEMGQTWASAMRSGHALLTILNERLRPTIARRLAPLGEQQQQIVIPKPIEFFTRPRARQGTIRADAPQTQSVPMEHPPSYPPAPDWNSHQLLDSTAVNWPQSEDPNFLAQLQGTSPVFGLDHSYPEQPTFPGLDISQFLPPDMGYFAAPDNWEGMEDPARSSGFLS
ncbi:Zn(2)-C6 fungal-type domain-containing protein [Favolaschia claudopus]|uniref:Zn(2)-C6 fungal-type domain-containing protein n=1 Tax=Favolaschia claudopus TaxID=2862362 RepID=A0AAW0CV42_9AGAR